MADERHLYKCMTSRGYTFYAVAWGLTGAQQTVQKRWAEWGYDKSDVVIVQVEVIADAHQFPEIQHTWLVVEDESAS